MIVVNGRMTCLPGREEDFVAAARTVVAATRANEPDCGQYECSRDVSDPSVFVFVEQWADGNALRQHVATEHYQAFAALTKEIVSSQIVKLHTVEKTRTL